MAKSWGVRCYFRSKKVSLFKQTLSVVENGINTHQVKFRFLMEGENVVLREKPFRRREPMNTQYWELKHFRPIPLDLGAKLALEG